MNNLSKVWRNIIITCKKNTGTKFGETKSKLLKKILIAKKGPEYLTKIFSSME